MPTPSIQTLVTDAQQILNLDSISAVRSVVAVALANANTGTPLNPNLTTQQLWNEFYQVVNKPKSDIESIIANQLMKLLYAPPAPGGAGADKQVIFNDGGVLAGDAGFTYNKATDALTLLGDLTSGGDAYLNGNEKYVYLFSNYNVGSNARVRFRAVGAGGGSGYGGDFRISTRATNNTWNTDVFIVDNAAGVGAGATPDANFRLTAIGAFATGKGGAYIETGEFNRYGLVVNNANVGATTNIVEIRKAGAAKAAFTAAGNLAFDNALGVDFSATSSGSGTMTSELLNDYEEGTFTPTIAGTSTAGTANYVVRLGSYTKVGRVVQFQIHLAWNTGTGTGGLRVSGLPFTANGTYIAVPNVYPIDISLVAGFYATGSIQPSTDQINIYQLPTGGGSDGTVTYDAAGQLIITGTYTV
jgi:hypothetical protein